MSPPHLETAKPSASRSFSSESNESLILKYAKGRIRVLVMEGTNLIPPPPRASSSPGRDRKMSLAQQMATPMSVLAGSTLKSANSATSGVYVEIHVDGESVFTQEQYDVDPVFNEHFHFPYNGQDATIRITVLDHDARFLGACSIPVRSLKNEVATDAWYDLGNAAPPHDRLSLPRGLTCFGRLHVAISLRTKPAAQMSVVSDSSSSTNGPLSPAASASATATTMPRMEITPVISEEEAKIVALERKLSKCKVDELIRLLELDGTVLKAATDDSYFTTCTKVLAKRLETAKDVRDVFIANSIHHTQVRFFRNVCQTKYALLYFEYVTAKRQVEQDCILQFNALHWYFDERVSEFENLKKKIVRRLEKWHKHQYDSLYAQRNKRLDDWYSEPMFKHMMDVNSEMMIQQALHNHQLVNPGGEQGDEDSLFGFDVSESSSKKNSPQRSAKAGSHAGFKEQLHDRQQEWTIRLMEIFRGREEILLRGQTAEARDLDRELTSDSHQLRYERQIAEQELIKHFEIRMLRLQKAMSTRMVEIDHFMQIYVGEQPHKLVPPNSFDCVLTLIPMLEKRYSLFHEPVESHQSFLSMSCVPSALSIVYKQSALDVQRPASMGEMEEYARRQMTKTAGNSSMEREDSASSKSGSGVMSSRGENIFDSTSPKRSLATDVQAFEARGIQPQMDLRTVLTGTKTLTSDQEQMEQHPSLVLMKRHLSTTKCKLIRSADGKLHNRTATLAQPSEPSSPEARSITPSGGFSMVGLTPEQKWTAMMDSATINPLKKHAISLQLLMNLDGIENKVFRVYQSLEETATAIAEPLLSPFATQRFSANDIPAGLIDTAHQLPLRYRLCRLMTPETTLMRPGFLPPALAGVRKMAIDVYGSATQGTLLTFGKTDMSESVGEQPHSPGLSSKPSSALKVPTSPASLPRQKISFNVLASKLKISRDSGQHFIDASRFSMRDELRKRQSETAEEIRMFLQQRAAERQAEEEVSGDEGEPLVAVAGAKEKKQKLKPRFALPQ